LDVLRAVAILGVLARHSLMFRTPTWDFFPVRAGWAGVDLFFVISGFLISGLLFSEYRKRSSINFPRFAIRRILKIWPPLYFLVLSTLTLRLIHDHFHGIQAALRLLLHDVLFMQSYAAGTWGHCWSLAVEEHFYILLPLTLWFLLRRARLTDPDPFRILPTLFVCLAMVLLAARLITAHYFAPYRYEINLFPTHLRIDSLFFGVVISYYAHFHGEKFSQFARTYFGPLTAAGVVLVAPCFLMEQSQPWMYTYGYAALYLGFGSLLIVFLHVPVESAWPPIVRALNALAYVGTFSYSIYLWHLAWAQLVVGLNVGGIPYGGLVIYYGGAIAAGILVSKLIEMPTLRLRDRLYPAGGALAPVGLASAPVVPKSRRAELLGSAPDSGPAQVAHAITNVDPV
jgi:peptidoglycan/LPS O-acetylase OafA/YrhL